LTINSDDSDAPVRTVNLSADVVATPPAMDNNTIANVRVRNINNNVFDLITLDNCANVSGEVTFTSESSSADSFKVTLTHQNGETVENTFMPAPDGGGVVIFSGINACDLPDGVIDVKAVLQRGSTFFPSTAGKPAVKHTVALNAPVLDTLPPFTLSPTIDVCGTSRASTTVMIEGGARTVSIDLDSATSSFCLTVPLRENQQNTLIATAIDNLSIEPKPIASAPPVDIVQVNPQDIVIAKAESRPLTVEEIDDLVNRGVISLNEAENFNVSMFTIVLTVGGNPQPIRISRPFVHGGPGVYFPRTIGVGPWSPGTLPPPPPPGQPGGGCRNTCIIPIIIVPPDNQGPIIPGVIIIDGRIKTLKEFFQVTLVISNTSPIFDLSNVMADINLPAGLTPINAGPGLDVSEINIDSAVDTVDMGTIPPGESGAGQFIIRGDAMGQYRIGLDFSGDITGGGLPVGVPFSGSASTSVEVLGPPELSVHVSHPSVVDGPDVELGQIYDLLVSIENVTADRPALYTSLQLFVGGGAVLVDEYGNEIAGSGETATFGHILPGDTVEHGFRVKSLLQGEIIACQAIAAENIILTIDTGPDGAACNIANTYPANFVPLPPGDAPVVIGINPLNGQPSIPITTSVVASFTPQTSCLRADTWQNLIVDFVDPNDPSKGMEILQADLDVPGTFYLEELDANDVPLHHVPVDLTAVDPPAGGTTIATLRLGLEDPLSEILLKPNTKYRATIKGGDGGVCSEASGQTMRHDFVWTFTTVGSCNALEPPSVEMVNPTNGSIDRPLDQVIELVFTNRDMDNGQDRPAQMDPQTVTGDFADIASSTFGVYKNADIQDGDIVSATPVSGTLQFSDSLDRLTFVPDDGELQPGDTIVVRLTDQIKDACGNPLQTVPAGVKLLTFQTVLPDTLPPEPPQVDPVPPLTREPAITMTGVAEPNSIVNIAGGAVITNVIADSNGEFTAQVQLLLDQSNSFTVKATDGNGNESDAVNIDVNGNPLVTVHDGTPPELIAIAPFDTETGVPVDTRVSVEFNEPLDPASVNNATFRLLQGGTTIVGTLAVDSGNPEAFTFTPTTPLEFDTEYTVVMAAGGISDEIGNTIPAQISTVFRTEAEPGGPEQTIFDLYARAKDSKIDIVWTPVDGADSYNVYRSTSQGGPYQLIAEGHVTDYAVYADFGLTNDVTYYYVVRSVTNGEQSLDSNEASATPVSLRTRRR
jgi:hypothetical protein